MHAHSDKMQYEQAAVFRNFLQALSHMKERVLVGRFKDEQIATAMQNTDKLKRLAEVIGLKKLPAHIEAFDNSHLFGREAVGCMVCFINGEKNHEHYRRFKIRSKLPERGGSDFAMMEESVYRRLRQLKRDPSQLPDLILLDVYMPEMDGHEVIKALKASTEYADIPVIFLTSDVEENTEIQGFSEGAIDFLRKPFRKNVAIQRIRRILELSYLQKYLQKEVERQTEVAESRRESVERLSWQMVQALASTIDAKDSYTNGHSTRVAQYSVMLAEKMGYTGEKLEQLQYAAMLHDIGKIGVPREIINKPSKLTDEEYAIIKTHPAIGENILKEVSEIPDIAIGARWHHERYDGKGYPDGIKGEEIPELARIIGVADAYDAMTSKRSYRDVLPQEVVIGELEKGKSTQFDPEIAEIMIELIQEDTDYIMHE